MKGISKTTTVSFKDPEAHLDPPSDCLHSNHQSFDPQIIDTDPIENDLYDLDQIEEEYNLLDKNQSSYKSSNFVLGLICKLAAVIGISRRLFAKLKVLKEQLVTAKSTIGSLETIISELKARLKRNSKTSHFPSSCDLYKPKPTKPDESKAEDSNSKEPEPAPDDKPKKKAQGAQPGHPQHLRKPLDPADPRVKVNTFELKDTTCRHCGASLDRAPEEDIKKDYYDIPQIVIDRIINQIYAYRCPNCGEIHFGDAPEYIYKAGLVSHVIVVLFTVLKGCYHIPIRKVKDIFFTLFREKFSAGYINKCLKNTALSLRPAFLEALNSVATKSVINIDETRHINLGKQAYVWVMATKDFVVFKISTRSGWLLEMVLGPEFKGTIISDCFRVYISFCEKNKDVNLQLCLAHLIRDFKFCAEFMTPEASNYGNRALELLTELFKVYHKLNDLPDRDCPLALEYISQLYDLKDKIIKAAIDAPDNCNKAKALAERFRKYGEYYFTFIENPDVSPTNNLSERLLREVVLDRKISYGTRSQYGINFCETIWTVMATLKQKGLSPMNFLVDSLDAFCNGNPLPSLINDGGFVDQKYVDQAKQEIIAVNKEAREARAAKKAFLNQSNASETKETAEPDNSTLTPSSDGDSLPSRPQAPSIPKLQIILGARSSSVRVGATDQPSTQAPQVKSEAPKQPLPKPPAAKDKLPDQPKPQAPQVKSEAPKQPRPKPPAAVGKRRFYSSSTEPLPGEEKAYPIEPSGLPLRASETVSEANPSVSSRGKPTKGHLKSKIVESFHPIPHRRITAPEPAKKGLEPAQMGLTTSSL
jgi:hypothetical protein